MHGNRLFTAIAGVLALVVYENLAGALADIDSDSLRLLAVGGGSLATFVTTFEVADRLHERFFWRIYGPVLAGDWSFTLTNQVDGSARTGTATVVQRGTSVVIRAVNFRPGVDGPYSAWHSTINLVVDGKIFLVYEVESSVDQYYFKRGVMQLQFPGGRCPTALHGHFFDMAPSNGHGPIVLRRNSKEQKSSPENA